MMMSCIYSVCTVLCSLFILPATLAQFMTECDRGVKRPHPRQENAFQIYVLSEQESKWIDRYCPAPQVFQPMECTCGAIKETTTTTTTTTTMTTTMTPPPPPPPSPQGKRKPWFEKSKSMQNVQQQRQQQDGEGKGPKRKRLQGPPKDSQMTSQEMASPWDAQSGGPENQVSECKHHRPREGNPGQYEQWTEGGWILMDCNWPVNSALVWSQELCRCDWGPERIIPVPDLSGVPAVCLMMLKLTFDDGHIKDVGRDLWLDLRHPYNMEAVRDDTAVGGWAGAFRGAGISVPFFKMNTLGSTFRIQFRFQLCDGHPDADLMLLNNGCVESDHLPSLQVSYRAWTNVLAFQMSTVGSMGPYREECHIHTKDPWVDVNIHYDKDMLDIFVNGQHCIRSTAYAGPIVQTDCPFTLLEDNYCGLLDEVVVTRGCNAQQES